MHGMASLGEINTYFHVCMMKMDNTIPSSISSRGVEKMWRDVMMKLVEVRDLVHKHGIVVAVVNVI
jgi:hypothetical protein